MSTLSEMHCIACDEQTVPMTEEAIDTWRRHVANWQICEAEAGQRLECQYTVDDVAQAMALANAIGTLLAFG